MKIAGRKNESSNAYGSLLPYFSVIVMGESTSEAIFAPHQRHYPYHRAYVDVA